MTALLDWLADRLYGPRRGAAGTLERVPDPEVDALVDPRRIDDEATRQRWEIHNRRAREAGCPCGKPATRVARYPLPSGAVHEWWTCAEHEGVESWAGGPDGTWLPQWTRPEPCGPCTGHCSWTSKIGADRPYEWYCPTKP
jgi:hypothetical protein